VNQDQEHLRLLSIFHYVMAGFASLFTLFALIYVGLGAAMLSGKMSSTTPPTPHAAHDDTVGGWIFVGVGAVFFTFALVGVVLNIVAGRSLARHERRTLCMVVAVLNCFHMPLGTLLGVFTLIVLSRPSVQALFNAPAMAPAGPPWPQPGAGYPPRTSPFSNPNP
jgi:hypothetical protein